MNLPINLNGMEWQCGRRHCCRLLLAAAMSQAGSFACAADAARSWEKRAAAAKARRTTPLPGVVLTDWAEPVKGSSRQWVYGVIEVAEWRDGKWGIEVELTPVPFCCGAKIGLTRQRRTDEPAPILLGDIDNGSTYSLMIRFV